MDTWMTFICLFITLRYNNLFKFKNFNAIFKCNKRSAIPYAYLLCTTQYNTTTLKSVTKYGNI